MRLPLLPGVLAAILTGRRLHFCALLESADRGLPGGSTHQADLDLLP